MEGALTRFTLEDAANDADVLAQMEEVWAKIELAIRLLDEDGGQRAELVLDRAADGVREAIKKLAPLGRRALAQHARETMFDFGLIHAGISPADVQNPYRID